MKKYICLFIIIFIVVGIFCSCSDDFQSNNKSDIIKKAENEISSQQNSSQSENTLSSSTQNIGNDDNSKYKNIDIDLSQMTANVVFAQVSAMAMDPTQFENKIVKITGTFQYYKGDNGKEYFICLVKDGPGCCQTGLEFKLQGDLKYPDDYPDDNATITVTGILKPYDEDGTTYCELEDATMICN